MSSVIILREEMRVIGAKSIADFDVRNKPCSLLLNHILRNVMHVSVDGCEGGYVEVVIVDFGEMDVRQHLPILGEGVRNDDQLVAAQHRMADHILAPLMSAIQLIEIEIVGAVVSLKVHVNFDMSAAELTGEGGLAGA
jgi:hypothetical protein